MKDITLTRGDKRDVLAVRLPTLPDRIHLSVTRRRASGFTDADLESGSAASQEANGSDCMACCWAALGLCLDAPSLKLPTLRDHERDVVRFGEVIATVLWEAGYQDLGELSEAGHALLDFVDSSTWKVEKAIKKEAEGFVKAPAEPPTAEGR